VAAAAQETLAKIPGEDVDKAIAKALGDTPEIQSVVMELVGKRRIVEAVPALFKAVENSDQQRRLVAIRALGETIRPDDLPALTNRLAAPTNAEESAAVQAALRAASIRVPDREQCAAALADCIEDAPNAVKIFLFELLSELGGDTALKTVSEYARSSDDIIQDNATRVLGEWTGVDAADALLALAESLDNNKYKIRTLRGYIRIVRQFVPDEQKPEMCEIAMNAAERVQEKQLILEVLGRVPSTVALSQVVRYVGADPLSKEASFAAVAISERIVESEPDAVAAAMKKVIDAGVGGETGRRAKALLAKAQR
jgi:HEAT repeat protein